MSKIFGSKMLENAANREVEELTQNNLDKFSESCSDRKALIQKLDSKGMTYNFLRQIANFGASTEEAVDITCDAILSRKQSLSKSK